MTQLVIDGQVSVFDAFEDFSIGPMLKKAQELGGDGLAVDSVSSHLWL